jgi:hypothetical protein
MELTLNIIWLAIALVAMAAAIRQRKKVWIGSALLCVVALLFPIISITDDLRWDVVFAEAAVKRRPNASHQTRPMTAVALGVIRKLDTFKAPARVELPSIELRAGAKRDDICSVPARAPPVPSS